MSILVLIIFSCEVRYKKSAPISAIRDTSAIAINEFNINFPSTWKVIPKYKGTTLMGLSPINDSIDIFRENISIQIFKLNDTFSSEEVATYLFNQSIKYMNSDYKIINQSYLSENSDEFYTIEYKYSFNNIIAQSKLICTVNDQKAYMLICTSLPKEFNAFYSKEFYPIVQSFKLKSR